MGLGYGVASTFLFLFSLVAHAEIVFDRNISEDLKASIIQDLNFVKSIKGKNSSKLHQSIYGDVAGTHYIQFFENRVKKIGAGSCNSKVSIACVIPFLDSNKVWITPRYINISSPQIARIMVLFHEARHSEKEGNYWPHAKCPNPFLDKDGKPITAIWTGTPLAGLPGCDTAALGTYGSSLVMIKNIEKFCENCSEKVKMDAALYGDDSFNRIIDPRALALLKNDLSYLAK